MEKIPKIVFIVPYRNRPQHKFFFSNYLTSIMGDRDDYEIYFSHQCDARSFNRGAVKNIGFLAIKEKYKEHYKDISFVFNDIDTIPFSLIFDFETTHGIVKHFYGFKYALGGILSIKGSDFEATNGYPNFWGWGMEDNVLQTRCEKIGLTIDRSQFYPIGSPDILHLFDGVSRIINRKDPWRATNDNGVDGLRTIHNLKFDIDTESNNPLDNIHVLISDRLFVINIHTFMTGTRFEHDNYYKYDLREPPRKIIHPGKIKTYKIEHLTDDWTNIPYYPTNEQKQDLIDSYGHEKAEHIIKYSHENTSEPSTHIIPPDINIKLPQGSWVNPNEQNNNKSQHNLAINNYKLALLNIQKQNELLRQNNSKQRIIPPGVNKFSSAYSRIIAAKPTATKSANIRIGGVY